MLKALRRGHDTDGIVGPPTEAALRDWLIRHLAARVRIAPEEVDTGRTFEDYALDSRVAVQVSGALEKVLERRLSPALLYEYQTIDELSAHLAGELALERRDSG